MSEFISGDHIYYARLLKDHPKSKDPLRPLYEAISNALDSFIEAKSVSNKLIIRHCYNETTLKETTWRGFDIEDNGSGFLDQSFERFKRWGDDRKSLSNRGTGRLQMLHSFRETCFDSVFRNGDNLFRRNFCLSKDVDFLNRNAIIRFDGESSVAEGEVRTIVRMKSPLDARDCALFEEMPIDALKTNILNHFMGCFCGIRDSFPEIKIEKVVNDAIVSSLYITSEDVPVVSEEMSIEIPYKTISEDGKVIEITGKTETFKVLGFCIPEQSLPKNSIKLTSKGQAVDRIKIPFEGIKPTDVIQGNRYLALISSNYLDSKDGDARGEFSILNTKGMKERAKVEDDLFAEGEILLDDLVDRSNYELRKVFPEINRTAEEQKVDIEKLKSMFLLDEETLGSLKFALNDSDSTILERVYKADAIKIAKLDAEMKSHLERLDTLDTTSPSFDDDFGAIIQEFSKTIPLQNRSALTQYVSRRNAVLVVFEKILNKKLNIQQNSTRNNDEKLLHNLFFKQKSEDTQASDLWVLNEEFIYFDGASELEIRDLKINNTNLIKQELTDEEKEFLVSQTSTKTRTERRPDVFLYPGEGKCILIELKNPNVDVSEHLNQLNKYATIIRNLARPEFDFMTFYGYLIGEKIDPKEVIIADGDFKHAPNLDYLFRPSKGIPHFFGKLPGEMYMEVLKYSTLLQRAKLRNKTFSEKLLGKHITF